MFSVIHFLSTSRALFPIPWLSWTASLSSVGKANVSALKSGRLDKFLKCLQIFCNSFQVEVKFLWPCSKYCDCAQIAKGKKKSVSKFYNLQNAAIGDQKELGSLERRQPFPLMLKHLLVRTFLFPNFLKPFFTSSQQTFLNVKMVSVCTLIIHTVLSLL